VFSERERQPTSRLETSFTLLMGLNWGLGRAGARGLAGLRVPVAGGGKGDFAIPCGWRGLFNQAYLDQKSTSFKNVHYTRVPSSRR